MQDKELWVFETYFQIVDSQTYGLIYSAPGRDPQFSPTGRFLFYRDSNEAVVLDIMARTEALRTGEYNDFAFVRGDSYFIAAGEVRSAFKVRSLFVDNKTDPQSVDPEDHGGILGTCFRCYLSVHQIVIDLEDALVAPLLSDDAELNGLDNPRNNATVEIGSLISGYQHRIASERLPPSLIGRLGKIESLGIVGWKSTSFDVQQEEAAGASSELTFNAKIEKLNAAAMVRPIPGGGRPSNYSYLALKAQPALRETSDLPALPWSGPTGELDYLKAIGVIFNSTSLPDISSAIGNLAPMSSIDIYQGTHIQKKAYSSFIGKFDGGGFPGVSLV